MSDETTLPPRWVGNLQTHHVSIGVFRLVITRTRDRRWAWQIRSLTGSVLSAGDFAGVQTPRLARKAALDRLTEIWQELAVPLLTMQKENDR
jgi:hypothetical protein